MNTARRSLIAISTLLAVGAVGAPAFAQTQQSVTGSIDVVQAVLNVDKTSDLSFGTVVRPTSGNGTISIDANSGAVQTSNGITVIGNGASRAMFTVTGTANANIQVTYPQSFNLTRTNGSETLQVNLTSTMGGGQIGGGGTVAFNMGGQIVLSSGTTSGAYLGNYTVTVAYN